MRCTIFEINQYRKSLTKKLHDLELARQTRDQEKALLKAAEDRRESITQVLLVAQEAAQQIQEEAHHKIADIVSRSLNAIFDEPYEFKINFVSKRGHTEAELRFPAKESS